MWQEAIGHVVGCWTNDEYEFSGRFWNMPKRRVLPKPLQKPHPPIWGATTSEDGHRQVGELGLGLCSFAVGISPAEIKTKVDIYRAAVAGCTEPLGAFVNNHAATFTMALCAPDRQQAMDAARQSFEWYPAKGASQIATVADWMAERQQDLGNYSYAADLKKTEDAGLLDLISLEYLMETPACVLGTPRGVCRDVPALRRSGHRPAAMPGEPLQRPPRGGDADHRAHGDRGHPQVPLTRGSRRPRRQSS